MIASGTRQAQSGATRLPEEPASGPPGPRHFGSNAGIEFEKPH
jgi:hypothetical protein